MVAALLAAQQPVADEAETLVGGRNPCVSETPASSSEDKKHTYEAPVHAGFAGRTAAMRGEDVLRIATWNVQNLFDALDDPNNRADDTYLPKGLKKSRGEAHAELCGKERSRRYQAQCRNLDWSEDAVRLKLERLACVILATGQPHLLGLQEVENRRIAGLLVERIVQLGGERYQITHIPDPTGRGIDVAILHLIDRVRQPVLLPVMHRKRQQRGILTARFAVPPAFAQQQFVEVAVVHFPSPRSSSATRASSMKALDQWRQGLEEDALAVALGDFNIPADEWQQSRISGGVRENWHVLHEEFCADCSGSHFYWPRKSWSFLDMILVARGKRTHWCVLDFVPAPVLPGVQLSRALTPEYFAPGRKRGVSDHLPLVAGFRYMAGEQPSHDSLSCPAPDPL